MFDYVTNPFDIYHHLERAYKYNDYIIIIYEKEPLKARARFEKILNQTLCFL